MRTSGFTSDPNAAIWQRVIELQGKLTSGAAHSLLGFNFSDNDHALMDQLSAKARAGSLTSEEQTKLDTYERLGCLLDIIHSKARLALKNAKGRPQRAS
jgi:hypothetical protein